MSNDGADKRDDLTEEELAALGSTDDGTESMVEDDVDPPSSEAAREDKPADDAPATPQEPAPAVEAEEQPTEPEADNSTRVAAPLRAQAPGDVADQLKTLDESEMEFAAKFDAGDITGDEFRKAMREFTSQRSQIEWQVRKAELAGEMQSQARENAWNREVADFLTNGEAASIAKSRAMLGAFDEYVKGVTSDAANAKLSDKQMLEKAWDAFKTDLSWVGVTIGKKDAPPSTKTKIEPTTAKKREIPPTLARVPASDIESTDDGKYASLDRLQRDDPEAYESAIGKMSEAEFNQYANSR